MNDLSDDLSRFFAFGCILALLCFLPLHAQTAATAPADTKATAATPTPAGQAPDSVTQKIADLVHAGKYAEAQQLTTGLLAAYPNDPRLIKTKALLDKLLATAGPAPGSNQPNNSAAPVQPPAVATAEPLTGMDKVDYNALIELARQAQATTDLGQQESLLHRYMDQSGVFLQKHPDQILLWQLRAASAISLNEPLAGYDAGQKLLALGAANSNDPNLQRLLAQLKNMGWLDKRQLEAVLERAEAERLKADHDRYTFPVERPLGPWRWSPNGYGHVTVNQNDLVYDASDGHMEISKSDIREIRVFSDSLLLVPKRGKTVFLFPVTEDDVARQRNLIRGYVARTTVIENALLERWKFVPNKKNTILKPSPGQDSAQTAPRKK